MNNRKYKFIDLFAGAGGLSEGFVNQGEYIPVAHVEMNRYAADTLKTRACYYYLLENGMPFLLLMAVSFRALYCAAARVLWNSALIRRSSVMGA